LGAAFRPRIAQDSEYPFTERQLLRLVGRREERLTRGTISSVRAKEANDVIDAISIEQISAAASAFPQPPEIVAPHDFPVIERHAPVLPGRAERVGRGADRHVETELMLPRPDIGAVAVHHERQIAEKRDAVRLLTRALPLGRGQPLQVLIMQHLVRQIAARAIDGRRLPPLKCDRPLGPWALALARMNRS